MFVSSLPLSLSLSLSVITVAVALQQFLDDHSFIKAQHVKDSSLITVVKIVREEEGVIVQKAKLYVYCARFFPLPPCSDSVCPTSCMSRSSEEEKLSRQSAKGGMAFLVDADNNQYIAPCHFYNHCLSGYHFIDTAT